MSHQKYAVIYARVSDPKQTGLGSQETRCREFARLKGYTVRKVFNDDMTGALANRPGMKALTAYLRTHKRDELVVIIDDISRLARGVTAHWELRALITQAGGRLESPSIEFGEDSDSIFLENILASAAQHQRQKNAEQVKNRMRARTMNGYWCFSPPIGYRYEASREHGKLLIRDEPIASIIQEALEGFASGRFSSQAEVKRFLESRPEYPKDLPTGEVRAQRIKELLTRLIYAGMVEKSEWNVSRRKGRHEGLISFETFTAIQKRLNAKAYAPARKDISADFPLRGAISCACCGRPLSAGWSKGKKRKYPYYFCINKACKINRKSIARADVEQAFASLLKTLTPKDAVFNIMEGMLKTVWEQRHTQRNQAKRELKAQALRHDREIKSILDRILNSTNQTVIAAYENRIAELEGQKLIITEKMEISTHPNLTFEELFEHAMKFLQNPLNLWLSGPIEQKRTVLKLAFSDLIPFCREKGFRTPNFSNPFRLLREISTSENQMVGPEGESSNAIIRELTTWNRKLKLLQEETNNSG